jgi:O-antigen/teichoic acid export membrane protein
MSQLKKGALLTYLNIFLTNAVGIVLTPFIIRSLGDSEYGLYTLIGSFVIYLSLMDMGLNNTIVRFVAKYRIQKNKKGEQEFLGTTMIVYCAISLILVILGLLLYNNIDSIFAKSLTIDELQKAKIMFLILVFNLTFSLPGGAFQAICNAYEHFVFPRIVTIIKYILRAICIVVLLLFGSKAIGLVILETVLSFITILVTAIYVYKKLNIKISLSKYDLSLLKEIFSYSFWVFLFGIVAKFQWNAGQVVLGVNTNTITVGIFGVGIMLGGYYGAFASAINGLLIPKATKMVIEESNRDEFTNTMIKIGRINLYILSFILTGFFLVGQQFILLWVGKNYSQSWIVALLIMIVLTLPLIQVFGNSVLEAKRKNKFKSIVSLVSVGIAVVLGYNLSFVYGIYGMIIPLVSAMALNSMLMNFYYKKIFGFNIVYFFKETVFKPFLIYGIVVASTYFILKTTTINSWNGLFLFIFLYSIAFIAITYYLLLNDYEKKLVFKKKSNKNEQ